MKIQNDIKGNLSTTLPIRGIRDYREKHIKTEQFYLDLKAWRLSRFS